MKLHAGRVRNAARLFACSSVALSSLLCATQAFADKVHDTLVYASDSEVENVSAYQNNLREGVILAHLIWDNLIYEDPATGQFKPELATAWKWESPTSLLLDLRHDVKFQNGDPFTAADVAFTFNYMTAPDSKVITRQNVDWIRSAKKVSDYQVRIEFKAPFPAALQYLAGPLPIYPEAYFRKVGPEGFSKAPVGTGPYRVTSIQPGIGVTLVKNPNYFSGSPLGQPKIGTIRFVVIRDPETRAAQLMTGAVDWIWRVPADQAQSLKATPNMTVTGGETMRIGFLTMDDQGTSAPNSPFKDVRVRQAVNYAINRAALANDLVRGGSQPIYAPCFHTQFGCDTGVAVKYGYDPAKARELLKEAGYPNGFETDLYAYRERDYAEAIIGDLRKVGIVAHLHFLQYAALRTAYRAGKTPMSFQAWGSYSVNDASASLGAFFKGGPDDTAKDPAVMKDIGIADTSNDPAERKAHYAAALKRISEQAYWAPLFSYSTNYAFTADLSFQPWPDELPRFYQASWK